MPTPRWKRTVVAFVFAVLAALAPVPGAADETPSKIEEEFLEMLNLPLAADCAPMDLLVLVGDDAAKIGLRRESIQTAAESRLRSARLFADDARDSLAISVTVVGAAFTVQVIFFKPVIDPASSKTFTAGTWANLNLGTHGQDPSFIVSSTSQLVDSFLVAYLRANEEACASR